MMERVPSLLQTANPEKVGAGVMKGLGEDHSKAAGLKFALLGAKG